MRDGTCECDCCVSAVIDNTVLGEVGVGAVVSQQCIDCVTGCRAQQAIIGQKCRTNTKYDACTSNSIYSFNLQRARSSLSQQMANIILETYPKHDSII